MLKKLSRRSFLKKSAAAAAGLAVAGWQTPKFPGALNGPFFKNTKLARKAIVLGMDGLDPKMVRRFVAEGKMPTFKRLMESGYFGELQTTMPPQSPVAWGSFISGTNPGGHGIFDFIHRDPATFTPYLSTSRSYGGESNLKLGNWIIPLESGRVDLLRKGAALWEPFESNDVPATIFQVPANFPVVGKGKTKAISGMGTPDLLGGYGVSTLYSDRAVDGSDKFTSVRVERVRPVENKIETKIVGPKNVFHASNDAATIDLTIYRDTRNRTVLLKFQEQKVLLLEGEWSDWLPLRFDFIPFFASASGAVRFLVKQVEPDFKLYMSPIQIDPLEPSMPICSPSDYSADVAAAIGRFHTQGLPADIKGLSEGALTDDEFLQQSKTVLAECERALDYELKQLNEGLLFFYFSSPDQNEHMLWRNMDPEHPLHDPNSSKETQNAVSFFYERMDLALNNAMQKADDSTLVMVMSDHGFAPFYREFHLSTWLVEQGYTAVSNRKKLYESKFFDGVDWRNTQAYALGINGLYLNLAGREKRGSLQGADADRVRKEIIEKLEAVIDPKTGKRVVLKAYDSREIYSGPFLDLAPDILVGYDGGYRSSDEAVLGQFPKDIFSDRTNKWAADHCMDPRVVPGTILTNWRCTGANPALWDMAPSIITAFGLPVPKEMTGRALLERA